MTNQMDSVHIFRTDEQLNESHSSLESEDKAVFGSHLYGITEEISKRKLCLKCKRPETVCWCKYIPAKIQLRTKSCVYILQHPHEEKRPLRTVPILTEALPESAVKVYRSKRFSKIRFPELHAVSQLEDAVLLYPGPDAVPLDSLSPGRQYHVLLLDGTWPQTRSMFHVNRQWLSRVRRVSLGMSTCGPGSRRGIPRGISEKSKDAAPAYSKAAQTDSDAAPMNSCAESKDSGAELTDSVVVSANSVSAPPDSDASLAEPEAVSAASEAAPVETDAVPPVSDTASADSFAVRADSEAVPSDSDAAPAESDASPTYSDAAPADSDAALAETDATPADSDAAPTDSDAVAADLDAEPADFARHVGLLHDGTGNDSRNPTLSGPGTNGPLRLRSVYVVRTQPTDNHLSTVESAALILAFVEGQLPNFVTSAHFACCDLPESNGPESSAATTTPDLYESLVRPLRAMCAYQLAHGALPHESKASLLARGAHKSQRKHELRDEQGSKVSQCD